MKLNYEVKNKKISLVIVITTLTVIISFLPVLNPQINKSLSFLHPSDIHDIIITSPEETMYSGGMDGYYPGTYDFDTQEIPSDWYIDDSQAGSSVTIEESVSGHNNVLKLSDNMGTVKAGVLFDSSKIGGIIDFWLYASNHLGDCFIRIYDNSPAGEILIKLRDGHMYYYDGHDEIYIQDYSSNKWYHFNIEFVSSSNYWILTINRKEYLWMDWDPYLQEGLYWTYDFSGSPEAMDGIEFYTASDVYPFSFYIDAVGFDWHRLQHDEWPLYDKFTNFNEGIFIDYYVSGTDLTNVAYSLNGAPFIEINPDILSFTIPFSIGGGQHTLEIIGEDSNFNLHVSELIEFSVPELLDWGVDAVDAEKVWGGAEDATDVNAGRPTGAGIKVLVIDTGIDIHHDDLIPNLDPLNYGHNFVVEEDPPVDIYGHGTHCAGNIGAADNNYGILGVAPEVELYAAKIGDSVPDSDLIDEAVQWAIDNDIDIISMSIKHGKILRDIYQSAFENHGITIVAASGNEFHPAATCFPARYKWVISVGAVRQREGGGYERQEFSNYGPDLIDVVAPGTNIYSCYKDQNFAYKSGTSMACPIVAGVCALILSDNPTLTNAHVRLILNETALSDSQTLPNYNSDEYGNGLVNAEAALNYDFEPTIELISPSDGSSYTRGSNIVLKTSAFDHEVHSISNPRELDRVEFKIDSGSWQSATYNDNTDLWEWTWDSSSYDLGSHSIKARVVDSYGHEVETSSIGVTLVNPSLSNGYPINYERIMGGYISGNLYSLKYIDSNHLIHTMYKHWYNWFFYQGRAKVRVYFDQSGYLQNYQLFFKTYPKPGTLKISIKYSEVTNPVVLYGFGEQVYNLNPNYKVQYIEFYHYITNSIQHLMIDFVRLRYYDYGD